VDKLHPFQANFDAEEIACFEIGRLHARHLQKWRNPESLARGSETFATRDDPIYAGKSPCLATIATMAIEVAGWLCVDANDLVNA
jgi:phage-related protein